MLKKFSLALVCCLAAACACAQNYEKGDVMLGLGAVFSPLGLGSDWGEVNVGDETSDIHHDSKLGKPGWGGELQAMYVFHPRFAAGLSFQEQYFGVDLASGWYNNVDTHQENYMAVGRYFLTPSADYKWYIPFAAGVSHARMTVDFDPKEHFRYTGFAWYAGLGVERRFSSHWSAALEARYNGNRFHDSKIITNGDYVRVYQQMNFMSGILRVNYVL